jgi:hypothetical protein
LINLHYCIVGDCKCELLINGSSAWCHAHYALRLEVEGVIAVD